MAVIQRAVLWCCVILGAGALSVGTPGAAHAQLGGLGFGASPGSRYELSDTVQLDRADTTVRTALERVGAYLADGQSNEAVVTLLEVMEQSGGKLLGVTDQRFVSVRDYCHLQVAALPPEALALYRSRIDPSARQWYEEGVARRDRRLLEKVVDQAFSSSWGDNALYMLGEMALESADYPAARAYWEKAIPVDPPEGAARTWLSVPDTDLDLAAIRARLVLVSILEGSLDRAREELAAFSGLHADARGRLGGREVNYVDALSALLSESTSWPEREPNHDWPTFAGSPLRNRIAPDSVDLGQVAWRKPLRATAPAPVFLGDSRAAAPRRVAEGAQGPLSYHPVLVDDLVLLGHEAAILAFDLSTGEPAWGHRGPEVYRDQLSEPIDAQDDPSRSLGVPRFTLTVDDRRLYARMGSAITGFGREAAPARRPGYLVCLDLEAEGRLVWKIAPPEPGYSFEGSPVTDGANVYVAIRRSDIQPQAHVACYEAASGRLRWRRFVCAAETPARGMLYERTHNLLTLHRETLYLNTNLGAVAALSARDGRVKWVRLYPRVRQGDLLKPEAHTYRDLTPCLFDRGILFVAPSDSRRIFALEAATGHILWQTGPEVADAVHLLGTSADTLIAGGDKLYWIGLDTEPPGKVKHVWPFGHEKLGYGRGVLAGDCVLWPGREKIYVFDQASGRQKKVISLATRGATGGNLLVAPGYLLIAGNDELVAFASGGGSAKEPPETIARYLSP